MRAPYQVLIFPYIITEDSIQYAIFNRSDYGYWQGIAGGGEDVYVIKEFSFGVKVPTKNISLSKEHLNYKWLCFEQAIMLLKWDSNKTALWELNKRLLKQLKY
ncbi:TPA: hypothetical protein ROY30_002345 [Bacillus cereus]|uniref:hypothetical protein n=1 Tax=Bacillus TaxID=1386 RepID=UPI000863E9E7|nr:MULTISPECIES: hypothetical protein [Bacillus]MCP1179422.1 hypothetical protein [Bacillus sp. 1663tsa1]MCP1281518.1 hypothetical protein [Bacillus sp. S0635]MCQ6345909.1 hypothetical protein [Bacillus cereus]MCU5749872.1 hypothetical protein [Bacillus cereus]SCM96598.1 Uncharacterized protein BCF24048_02566 [Bacillus cereus]